MPSTEHEALVAAITASGHPPTPEVRPSLEQLQAAVQNMNDTALPIDPDIEAADGELGGVPGIWFRPAGADQSRIVVYFHGGGYMFGTPRNTGHVTARLARASRSHAFSVDYRLSWKAPFPAPVEDALAVYRALLARGYEPSSIALAGDSAGGGLVIATLVALRDAGDPLPAAAFASSAFTDCTVSGDSAFKVDDPIATRAGLCMLAAGYLNGADPATPLASPLFADLRGLPPLLLQVGSREALLDDTTRLAERARAAGVDVTLDVLEGVIHIWQYFGPDLPETRASEADAGDFLQRHLGAAN
jgi:acetyl esterase/lipase